MYVVFVLYPILSSFRLSFYQWDGVNPVKIFVGFRNFVDLFGDAQFGAAVLRSLRWMAVMSVLPVAAGLIVAAMLAQNIRGRLAYRSLFYIPVTMATSATGAIWRWMYNPFFGLINEGLKKLGLPSIAFLSETAWVFPALFVAETWARFGFYMVIFLAGIQGINPSLYDAAVVDGANKLQEFRYITIPSLRNVITLTITVCIINSLKVFTIIMIMTSGGPNSATETISMMLYRKAFQDSRMGYGSAMAVVFSLCILVLTVTFRKLRNRLEN